MEIKRQYLIEENENKENENKENENKENENKENDNKENGFLSFDLGYKHMTAAYTQDFNKFNIFLFDIDSTDKVYNRVNQIKLNIDKIINICGKIQQVIIEEQVQTNIQALNIMYALCMYFDIKRIRYNIQPARLKYKFFENRDQRQFKNLSSQYVSERIQDINIVYQNYDPKPFQNHRWMNDNFRQWLQQNKIDKADDIGDVILILKYFNEHQNDIEKKKKKMNKQ